MALHVSFSFVLTFFTLVLTLLPTILIWVMFAGLLDTSVNQLENATSVSINDLSASIQNLLLQEAVQVLNVRLTEGQNVMTQIATFLNTTGLMELDLGAIDVQTRVFDRYPTDDFTLVKSHPLLNYVTFEAAVFPDGLGWYKSGTRLWWQMWIAFYFNAATKAVGTRTVYLSEMFTNRNLTGHTFNVQYVNQYTGQPEMTTANQTYNNTDSYTLEGVISGWDTDLGFNVATGIVELGAWTWVPAQNNTWVQIALGISAATMSQELHDQLAGLPNDRLVMIWTQPHGHMLAASNGKYWSESDVNQEEINPLTNPPNIAGYQLWTCNQSTDLLISSACNQLYDTYHSWMGIPDLRTTMLLNGSLFWVAVGHSTVGINVTVIMIQDQAAILGPVAAVQADVEGSIASRKTATYIVMGVITCFGLLLPLTLGIWLGARLLRLASEMDDIAKLQFDVVASPPTVFSELHRFQTSFHTMERGLRAFGQFVPQAVVRVLLSGKMNSGQTMANQTVTIMFADIEGFSTICETIHSDELAEVCTEYFEVMCGEMVAHHGTIDKFIGDCIMGIWNAPTVTPGHEQHAVEAALAMQTSVLALHPAWRRRSLPMLKFRLGIHTGTCLIGNFGCSYRVSYTCLGDSVNLASRLESLNKKFGTSICISQATYDGCQDRIRCRRLAKATVPGKSEILPVYEVLCLRSPEAGTADAEVVLPLEALQPLAEAKAALYHVQTAPCPEVGEIVYHWAYVNTAKVLEHCGNYEAAYDAMLDGDFVKARRLLQSGRILQIPDKAWSALEEQLQQLGPVSHWNGVFYFTDK